MCPWPFSSVHGIDLLLASRSPSLHTCSLAPGCGSFLSECVRLFSAAAPTAATRDLRESLQACQGVPSGEPFKDANAHHAGVTARGGACRVAALLAVLLGVSFQYRTCGPTHAVQGKQVLRPAACGTTLVPGLPACRLLQSAPCSLSKGALVLRYTQRTGSTMMLRTPLACRGAERCCSPSRAGVPRGASSAAGPASPLTSTALRAIAHCTHRQATMPQLARQVGRCAEDCRSAVRQNAGWSSASMQSAEGCTSSRRKRLCRALCLSERNLQHPPSFRAVEQCLQKHALVNYQAITLT